MAWVHRAAVTEQHSTLGDSQYKPTVTQCCGREVKSPGTRRARFPLKPVEKTLGYQCVLALLTVLGLRMLPVKEQHLSYVPMSVPGFHCVALLLTRMPGKLNKHLLN